jgi:hypothetical protein
VQDFKYFNDMNSILLVYTDSTITNTTNDGGIERVEGTRYKLGNINIHTHLVHDNHTTYLGPDID